MAHIERQALERASSLQAARAIVDSFCYDRTIYTDEDVHLKRGICKSLAEEYCPLVRLAQEHWLVRSVRLFPGCNPGPDGEIRFWWRQSSKVQIVCANEGYSRALMREQLANGDIVFPQQDRARNKNRVTNEVVSMGRALTTPDADYRMRVQRILEAIGAKESKFYPGTDTLLVQDDVASFAHLRESGLHLKICEAIREGIGRQYARIYIIYGNRLDRAK